MNSNSGGIINLAIVWGVASAAGFFVMAALMVMGDWTLIQALFAAAVVFVVLGSVLSFALLKPLPGPVEPGSAGMPKAAADPTPAPEVAASAPEPELAPAPEPEPTPAPVAAAPEPAPEPAPAPAASGEATRPEALEAARDGGADDLKKIKGIGPKLEKLCNTLGFYHFDQIASWSADEVAWVDTNLEGFKGRVTRDNWVEQARLLAAGQQTDFSKRVDKGDVY